MAKKKPEKSLEEMLEETLVKEDEQPYEVLGNWVWVYTGAAHDIVTGTTPPKKNPDYYGNYMPFVKPNDLKQQENLTFSLESLSIEGAKVSRVIPKNSTLLCCIASIGKAAYTNVDCTTNQQINSLIPDISLVEPLYSYYNVISLQYQKQLLEKASATTVPIINKSKTKMLYFPLPPLPEQKRIVKNLSSMLGKLKDVRELIQEARDTFEERRAAILNKAFTGELTKKWRDENPDVESSEKLIEILIAEKKNQGKKGEIPTYEEMIIEESEQPYEVPGNWEFVRLGKVVQINPPKYKPEIGDDTLCSFVPMRAVSDKLGIIENIEEKPFGKIKNGYTSFKENDVLFAKITPCMENGKAAIAKNLINGFGYGSTEFFVFRCSTVVDNNFLYYLVRSKSFRDLAEPNMTGTVGQRRVQKDYLHSFKFPIPPLEEQKEIVRILEKLLDHEDEASALIDMEEQIDLLEKSILSKAFRGELGTNDTNDDPAIELLKRSLKEKATPAEKQDK